MRPQVKTGVDMLVAEAQQKLRELKELQFFGGDALNLKRWTQTLSIPADGAKHCWQVVMTPEDIEKSMPFEVVLRPGSATAYTYGQAEAVHRTDNKYEYLIITGENWDAVAKPLKATIEYTGKATFNITQIG